MYIKQSDLLWGLDHEFVKRITEATVKETYKEGDRLFKEGDPADFFFILLRGRVKLSIGREEQRVHTVNHAGEAFGWSSLVGRDTYSAGAECREPTLLTKIDRETLEEILESDPKNGSQFMKRLCRMLGNRLIQAYTMLSSNQQAEEFQSFGTGQIVEPLPGER